MLQRTTWLLVSLATAVYLLTTLYTATSLTHPLVLPGDVIISEVGWGGTAASSSDEWLELYNNTNTPLTLTNWTLQDADGGLNISLNGVIAANGFFLLERTGDDTLSDIPADQIYVGSLSNSGESLTLRDATAQVIDTVNGDGGAWPAGNGSPTYYSMERNGRTVPDLDANWSANDGLMRNGLDANGNPVNGTPRQPNSTWAAPPGQIDLAVQKTGPAQATSGDVITYQLQIINQGDLTATAVMLTDTLPHPLTYLHDTSGLPVTAVPPHLIWQLGDLGSHTGLTFTLTAQTPISATGLLTNQLQASSTTTETVVANNQDTAVTHLHPPSGSQIILEAVYYDGYELNDLDEAIALRNISPYPVDLSGWQLSDGDSAPTILPANTLIPPQTPFWIARHTDAFSRQFGFAPAFVPATWPGWSNTGDEVLLLDNQGVLIDTLVYEDGDVTQAGWTGTAVFPYTVSQVFAEEGQILYRRRDQATGYPVADTNTAADWAQQRDDLINGRKILYPGWDLDTFFFTRRITETAVLTIALAPDNAYETIVRHLDAAQHTLYIESHTFENLGLADAFIRAAQRGVSVTVLLEGAPVGGLPDQEKYVCGQLEAAGGQCWFIISDTDNTIYDRYKYLHSKFILIDTTQVIISSENLSPNSFPSDDKQDGTWGRRGVVLITDAPGIIAQVAAIFAADFDVAHHLDLRRWHIADPVYGPPPVGFVPITLTGGITYPVRAFTPTVISGVMAFELVQSPENSLRDVDSLLGLIRQAGAGDVVLVQQLGERPYWGQDALTDPNPRLAAYIAAAQRGATVRLLLDSFFDISSDPLSNTATCTAVNTLALAEHLDLSCRLANPTGLGIHNKMVLVQVNGRGYIHIGSINGSEQAHKGNREVALQVQSDAAYAFLAEMFTQDWPHRVYLPLVFHAYRGPAQHLLISEVLYDPAGPDDAEFVELANPTPQAIDLSGYALGDAVNPTDYEDVQRFPPGTILPPGQALVVATSATGFWAEFGRKPDFEILETDTAVPNLLDDLAWGDPGTFLQLGNTGDEIILRDSGNQVVDVVVYGLGTFPGVIPCPLTPQPGYSLERFPYWQDQDDCTLDFRAWPFANPGILP